MGRLGKQDKSDSGGVSLNNVLGYVEILGVFCNKCDPVPKRRDPQFWVKISDLIEQSHVRFRGALDACFTGAIKWSSVVNFDSFSVCFLS